MNMNDLANLFLWRALAIFLLIGASAGVAVSLLMIFNPRLMERAGRIANRWISTRRMERWINRSMSIEHWFYLHHRLFGILAVMGACYILIYFGLLLDKSAMLHSLSKYAPSVLLDVLLDALVLAALIGATVALFTGLFLWLRPSLLRGIEQSANQWVSLRRAASTLDVPHLHVERFAAKHAPRMGWLLLLASVGLFFTVLRAFL